MTIELIKAFPQNGGEFQIEADASSGSYFLAAEMLLPVVETLEYSAQFGAEVPTVYLHGVSVANWPSSGWQIDQDFSGVLLQSGLHQGLGLARIELAKLTHENKLAFEALRKSLAGTSVISRRTDLGDSIMTAVVLAPLGRLTPVQFTDLARLRVQECERVAALRTELTRCGAKVVEEGDTLTVFPSPLHGAEIETYNDHRMAMCFAILGLRIPGIRIKNPACVKKTFPDFFQKLAAAPPHGLGVTILDAKAGRPLDPDALIAE